MAKGSLGSAKLATLAGAAAIALIPAPAAATVYAIADDGQVSTLRSGRDVQRVPSVGDAAAVQPEAAPDVPKQAITNVVEPAVPAGFRHDLMTAAEQAEVSPRLLAALATQESRWRAQAVSPKGAVGLTQLMPATARALAVDARDPAANLSGGARYLRRLIDRFDGNIERALAAYNAGPGRVARVAGIPAIPETRAYVATIVDGLGAAVLNQGRN